MAILRPPEIALAAIHTFGAMQKPEEFTPLYDMVEQREPKVIVEIGFGKGGTAWAWSKLSSVDKLVVIDLPAGPFGGSSSAEIQAKIQFIANNTQAKVSYVAGHSQNSECLAALKEILAGDEVDFLWIDGDHTHIGVKADFLTYKELVKEGGLIAFHDIALHSPESKCEVRAFWDEVKDSGIPSEKYSEFIFPSEPSWGGIGIIEW